MLRTFYTVACIGCQFDNTARNLITQKYDIRDLFTKSYETKNVNTMNYGAKNLDTKNYEEFRQTCFTMIN